MPTIEMTVDPDEVKDVMGILDTYRPRVTYVVAPKRWWQSHLKVIVAGEEPYLSNAQTEIEAWQEERFLRRAW